MFGFIHTAIDKISLLTAALQHFLIDYRGRCYWKRQNPLEKKQDLLEFDKALRAAGVHGQQI